MENINIPEELLGGKRKDYLNLDELFMASAVIAAARSKDPSSQVGACLSGSDNRILSLGYNGTPNNWDDDKFPWEREAEDHNYTKYPYVIHSEMNAILNYKGDHKDLVGATCYVTLFPCSNCAKFLAQAGIKKIVYLSNKYENTPDDIAAKTCLKACGVTYEQFPEELQRDLLVSLRPNMGVKEIEKEKVR